MGTSYNTNVVIDGLVGCWDAGNRRSYPGAGTTWTDPVGGIKGTLENEDDDALNFNSFKGGYLEFDGTDGRVDCGQASDNKLFHDWGRHGGDAELSVCVWALAIQGSQSSYGLVYLGNPFEFSIAPPAHQRFIWATIDGTSLTADVGCMDPYWGKWAHYAVRWVTGTDNYRLYINGEVIKTGTFNDTHISRGSNEPLYLACRIKGSSVKNFEGNMGSVYIYDRALSNDEIKQNYEATKSRFEPRITKSGLVGNWDAGDPESYPGGTTLKDTANHYDGTLENGDDGSLTFDPANGGSLNFDGTDDYINCGNVTEIDGSSTMSYCMWAKLDAVTGSNTYIAKWKYSSPRQGCFAMQTEDVGGDYELRVFVAINLTEGGGNIIDTADAPLTTNWQHVSVVYDGSLAAASRVAIYVDGVKSATSATLGTIPTSLTSSSADLEIGRFEGLGRHFGGNISSVRLYTRALSAAEIMDNFQKTRGRFGV